MNFAYNLEIVCLENVKLTSSNTCDFEKVKNIFRQEEFQNNLNDCLYEDTEKTSYNFLKDFVQNLVSYLESPNEEAQIQSVMEILLIISRSRIKQFITIDSNLIFRILVFLKEENVYMSTETLEIVVKLSESKYYGKLNFDMCSLEKITAVLDDLSLKLTGGFLASIKTVQSNLNENTIEDRLVNFNKLLNNINNLEEHRENVIKDLSFLSKELNFNNQYFETSLYFKHDSFAVLTQLFGYFIGVIEDSESDPNPIRDLCEIIFKLVQRSMIISDAFLAKSIFKIILKLFDNTSALKFFFDRYKFILYRICRIFYYVCKQIFYIEKSNKYINGLSAISLLKKTSEALSSWTDSGEQDDKDNTLLRIFLLGVSYLHVKYFPNFSLFETKNYLLAGTGVIQSYFVDISAEYLKISELVRWEFRNEFGLLEVCKVNKLTFPGLNRPNVLLPYIIVDVLNNIKCLCFNDQIKMAGFARYKNFFLTIIYFGLVIEKILSLNVLKEFLTISEIRRDLLNDQDLKNKLKDLKQSTNLTGTIKNRLFISIDDFESRLNDESL